MSNPREELALLERSRSLDDFYWFSKYIFGNKDMVPHVHGEFCSQLEGLHRIKKKSSKEGLFLMPRGTFKTACGAQAYPTWRILHNRDIRILIASATLDLAQENLRTITGTMLANEEFRGLFGDLIARDDRGKPVRMNMSELMVSGRSDRGRTQKEPTVTVGAPGKLKVGMHYDLIIFDDVVTEANVTTSDQIRKIWTYYAQAQSLLDPGGTMVVIGTRYKYDDLYGWLLEQEIPDRVICEKAIQEDGSLFFPERLNHEVLREIKRRQGHYIFHCQYQNEPTNEETAVFLKEDFRYIGTEENEKLVPDLVTRFLLVDPAKTTNEESDYSALVTVSVDESNNIYIEDAEQVKCVPSQLIEMIYGKHRAFNYEKIGIEQVGAQSLYDWILDRVDQGVSDFIPVVPVRTTTTVTKEMRIRSIEPFFKQHRVYLRKGLDDLETQLLRFPNVSKDDLIDALSMFPRIAYSPKSPEDNRNRRQEHSRKDNRAHIPSRAQLKARKGSEKHWMFW